ncbi:MAG TPA: nuclease-related domain-containing protein [Anaerolineales bacterium]|nr:nuclease-related domain-containing protein [Anaerolineales bacterium]
MRIGYRSPLLQSDGSLIETAEAKAIPLLGPQWHEVVNAEEQVFTTLQANLPDDFLLVRNLGSTQPTPGIDFLLMSKTGIWAFYLFTEKGLYQIESNRWLRYVPHMQTYVEEEHNWVKAVRKRTAQLMEYFQLQECPPWVHPVLVLTHADSEVELREAALSAVTLENLPKFLEKEILNRLQVLSGRELNKVVRTLGMQFPSDAPTRTAKPPVSPKPQPAKAPSAPAPKPISTILPQLQTWQWALLVGLMLLNCLWVGGLVASILW